MMLLEELFVLLENKFEYIVQQYGSKLTDAAKKDHLGSKLQTPEDVVKELIKADPSNGKNLMFITRMFLAKQFKLEDLSNIKEEIAKFEKYKANITNKDLNTYKTLSDLYDVTEPFGDKEAVSGKQAVKLIKSDAKKLIDTPDFKVVIPTTEAAAKFYGAGTKWCTAGDNNNMYLHYAEQGTIYVLLVNLASKNRKFQLHVEDGQFMDERNIEVNNKDIEALSKLPVYNKFINMMIKKHYEEAIKALEGEV